MLAEGAPGSVDLVVNTYRGDLPFLDVNLRHLSRMLEGAGLRRRILVVDRSVPEGRFSGGDAEASVRELEALAARLRADGVVDDVTAIDWDPAAVARVMKKWYGDPDAPLRCRAGSANFQYCAAVEASDADYILHLDSDVLLTSPDRGGWVREAIGVLRRHDDAIAVQPMGGPPMATTLAELVFGPRARTPRPASGGVPGGAVSSRAFLVDRARLEERFLPLAPDDPLDRWEQAMTSTAARRGFHKYTLADERSYVLHPLTHDRSYLRALPGLVWAAERGVYPFRRSGYRWDVRTTGVHVLPWRAAIALARVSERTRATKLGGRARFGGRGA